MVAQACDKRFEKKTGNNDKTSIQQIVTFLLLCENSISIWNGKI